MTTRYMEPCVELPLDKNVLCDLVDKAKDWALMHGVCLRSKENYTTDSIPFAPFLLLPSTFPRSEFQRSIEIQIILNLLTHHVAHDHEFLTTSLENTIKVDEFTGRLFKIYETVRAEGVAQKFSLGLLRSDYFVDSQFSVKQVEINTVASSFGALSTVLTNGHRYVLTELGDLDKLKNLPENKALQGLCGGMLKAWEVYNRSKAAILFVIENVTYNICDQRFHEFELKRQNPSVLVLRKNLTEIGNYGTIDDEKRLWMEGIEIGVIYFRAGYTPTDYHSELEWDARLLMERSLAIKCPSIHYHLAGTKKVQQELARPGPDVLEKYLSRGAVKAVQDVFTELYSLDRTEEGDRAIDMAIANPNDYVLKPQREGGGNNIYGEDIRDYLEKIRHTEERSAWILMAKINPPLQKNYMLRPNLKEPIFTDVVSELGIFGVIIGDKNSIIMNEQVGHMLRTKLSSANEGGVAAGLGALDSVYLMDF